MATRYFGQPIKRNEDPRLLTGQALFTDDVHLPGMLHVAFYRSPYAHARINSIDTSAAAAMPGVVAIYTAADLGDYWQPGPLLVPPPPVKVGMAGAQVVTDFVGHHFHRPRICRHVAVGGIDPTVSDPVITIAQHIHIGNAAAAGEADQVGQVAVIISIECIAELIQVITRTRAGIRIYGSPYQELINTILILSLA